MGSKKPSTRRNGVSGGLVGQNLVDHFRCPPASISSAASVPPCWTVFLNQKSHPVPCRSPRESPLFFCGLVKPSPQYDVVDQPRSAYVSRDSDQGSSRNVRYRIEGIPVHDLELIPADRWLLGVHLPAAGAQARKMVVP